MAVRAHFRARQRARHLQAQCRRDARQLFLNDQPLRLQAFDGGVESARAARDGQPFAFGATRRERARALGRDALREPGVETALDERRADRSAREHDAAS